MQIVSQPIAAVENAATYVGGMLSHILLSPSSLFSVWALATTFVIAVGAIALRRPTRLRPAFLKRALFPRKWLVGRSARADWGLTFAGFFVFPAFFAATTIAAAAVSSWTLASLNGVAAGPALLASNPDMARAITTLLAFLAFEFAYFIDHYLSHKVRFLWEFHKVHHSAETLSPATVFRVHPIDSLVYSNIAAFCIGPVTGLCMWLFGPAGTPFLIDGMNLCLIVLAYLLVNLQHSQMWIPFRGWLGHLLLSPAHHQLHHSADPQHFNSNFGNVIGLWDWLFRSLLVPMQKSPRLKFGVPGLVYDAHSPSGLLAMPFVDAARGLVPERHRPAPVGATNA